MKVCTFCKMFVFLSFCFSTLVGHAQYKWRQYGHNTPNTCQSQCNQPSRERTYGIIYSANYNGDFEMIGNTLLRSSNVADMNDNTLGNYRNMVYVDADGVSGTSNSSAASLNLPTGSTIEFARIYWGGMVYCQNWNVDNAKQVKVKKDNNAYTTWTAARINYHPDDGDRRQITYQAYIDVTSWLKSMGTNGSQANGTYWVANIQATTGYFDNASAYGGWTLVVAYKNSSYPLKSIRLYDGYENVYDEGHAYMNTIKLLNLDVPSGTNTAARLGMAVWEGDGDLTGEYTKFNGTKLSNSSNPVDNNWNGTISGQTTTSTRTPSYNNQMSIDIDQFNISGLVKGGDREATVVCYTTGDSYYPGVFCFSASFNTPRVNLVKGVRNENGTNYLTLGRVIYTLTATNVSTANGLNSFVIDTIPPELSVPTAATVQISTNGGTTWTNYSNYSVSFPNDQWVIKINLGSGATTTNGGTLAPGQNVMVRFYANVLDASEPVTNLATVYTHDANGNVYTNEASTTINPANNSPLPAQFENFDVSKANGFARLDWTTLTEAYNKTFEVQRSYDGINFTTIGSVRGSGSTESKQQYNYLDPLVSITSRIVYYRLKLKSIDGIETYTKVVALILGNGSLNNFTVYPNPFKDNIKLLFESGKATYAKIKLNNATGQTVWSTTVELQKGSNVLVLDKLTAIESGTYVLQLTTADGTFTQKVIKP